MSSASGTWIRLEEVRVGDLIEVLQGRLKLVCEILSAPTNDHPALIFAYIDPKTGSVYRHFTTHYVKLISRCGELQ